MMALTPKRLFLSLSASLSLFSAPITLSSHAYLFDSTHLCPGHGFFTPVDVWRLLQGGIISDMTWTMFDFDARRLRKGPVRATVLQGWKDGPAGP